LSTPFFKKICVFSIFFQKANDKEYQGLVRSYALTRKYQIVQKSADHNIWWTAAMIIRSNCAGVADGGGTAPP